jgi:WD40 repeat protein/serine/threonine protein kinase
VTEESLFVAALEKPTPAQRQAFLEEVCGQDVALRARVQVLLEADARSRGILERRPALVDATATYTPPATVGQTIAGRYKLLEEIGEGGMGTVWVAEQTEPVKRKVALKLIKPGMDSKAVLARFAAERQALALMDHPNIAKVLDGGLTETGRPFFVMEYVKGVPITEYCDATRLSVPERLDLFTQVCSAVQHAHQKGIIHRDLKPSNILVAPYDGKPVPKVIDFGLAKAMHQPLTERTLHTAHGTVVGTPVYMSPEQAQLSNLDVDTRTDVYSLGVLLYELLTGTTPLDKKRFRKAAWDEVRRIICEEEAPRPSTRLSSTATLPSLAACRQTKPVDLTKLIRGELDWIVMKALEKDRSRRYDTATALRQDIQRYLADEVVEARPPSMGYRVSKFVRRHKGQVIAASLVLLALVGGIVGTTLGLFEARRQEQIAHEETAEKEKARLAEAERVKERDAALKLEALRVKERDAANDELRHRLGVSAMLLATAAYDSRDYELAVRRLSKVPVEQRGWEWRYLKRQIHGGIFTLYGHTSGVKSAAYSPDGTRIVTAGGDENHTFEAKVWDARTGMHLFDLKGLPPRVQGNRFPVILSAAFSPDGKRILTAGGDKAARVHDVTTGSLQLELKGHGKGFAGVVTCNCAAFSPDGARIVTAYTRGTDSLVMVRDARTGEALREWRVQPNHYVACLAFSPDGARILTGGLDQAVKVWEVQTGKLLLSAKGMMSPNSSVAFSPDGQRIVAGQEDGTAKVIDAQTGAFLLELKGRPRLPYFVPPFTRGILGVAFSPDGTRIVTAGVTGEACVWDARTGAELLELKGHTFMVMNAAFSPDGERIITASADGTAKVWDARTGTPRLELGGIKGGATCAAFSPDGTWIVAGGGSGERGGGEATVWDARTGMPRFTLKGLKGRVESVTVSKDGTRFVTGGEAAVWDARTGQALVELKRLTERVIGASFSPDGPRIATRTVTGGVPNARARSGVKVWDMRTGALLRDLTEPDPHSGGVMVGWRGESVAFSPDGTRIVLGGYRTREGRATVADVRTGATLVELIEHNGAVHCAAFGGDGKRVVTGGSDMTVKVWDAEKGGPALLDLRGHTGEVNAVAFSPDGTRIISGSEDRTVRVWDARTGVPLAELKGHRGGVTSVSFSADGNRLLTAGGGEVFVWDAPIPSHEVELVGHTSPSTQDPITATAFNADGTRIATAQYHVVKVWDAREGTELATFRMSKLKSLAFSSDGMRIVTEGHDKTTKVWDARTGRELKGEAIPETVRPGQTSPDGRFLAFVGPYPHIVKVFPLVPDEAEIAYRRLHAQTNASRYRKTLEMDPKDRNLHLALGELLVKSGRTEEAVDCYLKASELDPRDTVLSLKVAALQAWFGRDDDFAATRRRILAFARGTNDEGPANEGAKACSIRPSADRAELGAALALGRAAAKAGPWGEWNLLALGMAEYRGGDYAAADAALLAAEKANPRNGQATGIAGFYRAMSLFRQGKADEARRLAAETAAKMRRLPADEKNPLAGGAHYDDLIWWLAYREAKALIGFDAAGAAPRSQSP